MTCTYVTGLTDEARLVENCGQNVGVEFIVSEARLNLGVEFMQVHLVE